MILVSSLLTMVSVGCETGPEERAGHQLFVTLCARCHGADGRGDGPDARSLRHPPRDFSNCREMSLKSDEDLRTVIVGGGVAGGLGGEMPAYPHLESHEIERLVDFVRSFCD